MYVIIAYNFSCKSDLRLAVSRRAPPHWLKFCGENCHNVMRDKPRNRHQVSVYDCLLVLFWTHSAQESTMFSCITTAAATVAAAAAAEAFATAAVSDYAGLSARTLSCKQARSTRPGKVACALPNTPAFRKQRRRPLICRHCLLYSCDFVDSFLSDEQLPTFLLFLITAAFSCHLPTNCNVGHLLPSNLTMLKQHTRTFNKTLP